MDKVKGYFKEKKIDAKFATAGRGQKLGGVNNNQAKQKISKAPTNNLNQKPSNQQINGQEVHIPQYSNISQDKKIYFRCPHIDPDKSLPRDEMIELVREFLYTNLSSEPIYFSILIIKTLNSPNVSKNAISILLKYLENLKQDPLNPTFRRIRCQNKIYSQKVKEVEGTIEFLNGIGFVPQHIVEMESTPNNNENIEELEQVKSNIGEEYLCIPESIDLKMLSEKVDTSIEVLNKAKGLELKLDRDARLYQYKTSMPKLEPPDNFFQQSLEEIKAFYAATRAKLELESQLRTKAMREADELKQRGGKDKGENAPYTFVRIKFPQNVVLQGTFEAEEPFTNVIEFVRQYCNTTNISDPSHPPQPSFNLITSWGQKLIPDDQSGTSTSKARNSLSKSKTPNTISSTLRQLKLVPTALLIFHPNESMGGTPGVAAVAKATYDTYLNERALANLKIV